MSRPHEVARSFQHSLRRLESCCHRLESLHTSGKIAVTEVELIYESAFLNAVSRFEGLLHDLLEEFVCGRQTGAAGHRPLISVSSRQAYRNILMGGKPYVDILPYDRCKDLAERFLREGKPFSALSDDDMRLLGQAMMIRNAIAHRSDSAIVKFRKKVNGVSNLVANRQFPGPFLRQNFRAHPVQTWNAFYIGTLQRIGGDLAAAW